MDESEFVAGDLSIRYLDEHPELLEPEESDGDAMVAAAVAAALLEDEHRRRRAPRIGKDSGRPLSAWQRAGRSSAGDA
jgi:hypothetical protein